MQPAIFFTGTQLKMAVKRSKIEQWLCSRLTQSAAPGPTVSPSQRLSVTKTFVFFLFQKKGFFFFKNKEHFTTRFTYAHLQNTEADAERSVHFLFVRLMKTTKKKQKTHSCCWSESRKKGRNENREIRQQRCKLTERLCVSQTAIWHVHSYRNKTDHSHLCTPIILLGYATRHRKAC